MIRRLFRILVKNLYAYYIHEYLTNRRINLECRKRFESKCSEQFHSFPVRKRLTKRIDFQLTLTHSWCAEREWNKGIHQFPILQLQRKRKWTILRVRIDRSKLHRYLPQTILKIIEVRCTLTCETFLIKYRDPFYPFWWYIIGYSVIDTTKKDDLA